MLNFEKNLSCRLVVYTVLLGDKEPLGNPIELIDSSCGSDLEIDFVCFTDNRTLQSDVWKFEYMDDKYLPDDKLSRRPKTLPHEYLSQYSISLYIDNIVTFKRLPNSSDLVGNSDYIFRVFSHAYRRMITEEADAIALLGYENIDTICEQLDYYSSQYHLSSITPLSTCTVILRTHNHPRIIEFGMLWWEQILHFSRRDQLSFDFCVLYKKCKIRYFDGTKHDNDLIYNMDNMDDRRIKSNFDAKRYAWIHRDDSEAVSNPKLHFLNNEKARCSDYSKRIELFSYICYKAKSSLGSHFSPRRSVSVFLNDVLMPYRGIRGSMLLVHMQNIRYTHGFNEEEFECAKMALSMMLNQFTGNFIAIDENDLHASDCILKRIDMKYDIVVVFGLNASEYSTISRRLIEHVNIKQGMLLLFMTSSEDIRHCDETQQLIRESINAQCNTSITHSYHDDARKHLANSVICYQW